VISRQMALPVILAAAALKGVRLARRGLPPGVAAGMLAGAGTAFVSTLASLRLITMLERSRSLLPYAVYRAALGTVALSRSKRT
jgi:undecaprenyl pyrophosphate phosphatase UppP